MRACAWAGGGICDPWRVHDRQFRTEIVPARSHGSTLSELLGFRRVGSCKGWIVGRYRAIVSGCSCKVLAQRWPTTTDSKIGLARDKQGNTAATVVSGNTVLHAVRASDGSWVIDSGKTCT